MTATRSWRVAGSVAALLLFCAAPAAAESTPAYKCHARGGVTYSDKPCANGQLTGAQAPRRTERSRPVPQDRATLARRAVLTEEERQECKALDTRLRQQQDELKALGDTATLEDEMPLVHSKRRYRELRC